MALDDIIAIATALAVSCREAAHSYAFATSCRLQAVAFRVSAFVICNCVCNAQDAPPRFVAHGLGFGLIMYDIPDLILSIGLYLC